ncbi:MAG: response regulator [Gammaproteobacteria bacterium]
MSIAISGLSTWRNFSLTVQEIERTAVQLMSLTRQSAAEAVFQLDPELANDVLSGLMNHVLFTEVTIQDELGQVLATQSRERQQTTGLASLIEVEPQALSLALPLPQSEELLGSLNVVLDIQAGLSDFYERATFSALALSVEAVVLAVVIFFVVVYLVTNPLSMLAERLAQIKPGSEKRLQVPARHKDDELGQLARSTNNYLDTVFNYQKELEESRQRLQDTLDNLIEGVIIVDGNGFIVELNRAAEKMLGYLQNSSVGHPLVGFLADEGITSFAELRSQARVNQHAGLRSYIRHRNGDLHAVEINKAYFAKESSDNSLWTIRDISEREDAEKERRELEEQLRHSQKMQAIGTLAGGIAHDFNNILAGISGYTELAQMELEQGQLNKEHLASIIKASNKAAQLISRIMVFSRKQEERREVIDMNDVAHECLSLLRQTIPSTISIKEEVPESALHIIGDETMMHQVLMNLFANAASALKDNPGEITICMDTVDREALSEASTDAISKKSLAPADRYLRVVVTDDGPGIPAEIIERIFEPYFTTKPQGEGTGIGLALVHSIVESHGGRIHASNTETGARFAVVLPLHAAEEPAAVQTIADEVFPALGHGKILIVEDDDILAALYPQLMQSLGYDHVMADNGKAGLAIYREQPNEFDLVITDQTMPELNGDKLILAIRQINPRQPVILCTGYSEVMNADRAQELNINRFLTKPVPLETLGNAIREVLAESRSDNVVNFQNVRIKEH